jgi:hypothetical protein
MAADLPADLPVPEAEPEPAWSLAWQKVLLSQYRASVLSKAWRLARDGNRSEIEQMLSEVELTLGLLTDRFLWRW